MPNVLPRDWFRPVGASFLSRGELLGVEHAGIAEIFLIEHTARIFIVLQIAPLILLPRHSVDGHFEGQLFALKIVERVFEHLDQTANKARQRQPRQRCSCFCYHSFRALAGLPALECSPE